MKALLDRLDPLLEQLPPMTVRVSWTTFACVGKAVLRVFCAEAEADELGVKLIAHCDVGQRIFYDLAHGTRVVLCRER